MNRLLPIMLLEDYGFYKSFQYGRKKYLGDPFNIVNILNAKGIDEACILNTSGGQFLPDFGFLSELASEAFFPLSYGGNVSSERMALDLIKVGFEKIVFNSSIYDSPEVLENLVAILGSQAVSVNIDYKRSRLGGLAFYCKAARKRVSIKAPALVSKLNEVAVGEVILSCVNRDGSRKGYDLQALDDFQGLDSQIVVNCGAKDHLYLEQMLSGHPYVSFGGASAFFLSSKTEGVLITYPERDYGL